MPKTREINEIKNGVFVRRHPSIREAAKTLGLSWRGNNHISNLRWVTVAENQNNRSNNLRLCNHQK